MSAQRNSTGPYELASQLLATEAAVRTGYTQLIGTAVRTCTRSQWAQLDADGALVDQYFDGCLTLFRGYLTGDVVHDQVAVALGDAPLHLGLSYHQGLPDALLSKPQFYRTDESRPGHVLEVQCPGSLWGDHVLLRDVLRTTGLVPDTALGSDLADGFVQAARRVLDAEPIIHHLLDNASAPHTMRYFLQATCREGGARYFGVSPGVTADDCNFIRSHSVYGLVAENHFRARTARASAGQLMFDLPPHLLFDQKLPLAWPFDPDTKDAFSDDVRALFAFTSVVRPHGVVLPEEEGSAATLEQFSKRRRRDRTYFMKYAGTDVSLNWGSKAVHALHKIGTEHCLSLLSEAADDFTRGRPWIIQKGDEQHSEVSWWDPTDDIERNGPLSLKFSRFYGDQQMLGALCQHRHFYKVHGQSDTVNSLFVGI